MVPQVCMRGVLTFVTPKRVLLDKCPPWQVYPRTSVRLTYVPLDKCPRRTSVTPGQLEKRCLDFALKCLVHNKNKRIFPTNQNYNLRDSEPFLVNFAKSESYKKSAVPYCQRKLNQHFMKSFRKFREHYNLSILLWMIIILLWCITIILREQ